MDSQGIHEHKPLSPGRTIRLIILHSNRDFNAELICSLQETTLHAGEVEVTPYEAISYTWGSNKLDHEITCDGQKFPVTANCFVALKHFRREKTDRTLWLDAISINQNDSDERNHQVVLMGDVYRRATKVLVWLGEGDADAWSTMKRLRVFSSLETLPGVWQGRKLLEKSVAHRVLGLKTKRLENSIPAEWFTRIWTIQEAVFAQHFHIVCGRHSMPVHALGTWIELLDGGELRDSIRMFFILRLWYDRYCGIDRTHSAVNHSRFRDVRWRYLLQLPAEEKSLFQQAALQACIVLMAQRSATDAADKVYALYAILVNLDLSLPLPDYRKDLVTIYGETMIAIVRATRSLMPLAIIPHAFNKTGWPSWIPDLQRTCVDEVRSSLIRKHPQFRKDFEPKCQGGELCIELSFYQSVSKAGSTFPTWSDEQWRGGATLVDTTIVTWLYRTFALLDKEGICPNGQAAAEALIQALSTDRTVLDLLNRKRSRNWVEALAMSVQHLIHVVLAYVSEQVKCSSHQELNYQEEEEAIKLFIDERGEEHWLSKLLYVTGLLLRSSQLRQPVILSDGSVGYSTGNCQQGDLVVLMYGSLDPVILRPTNEENRYRLIGPANIQGMPEGSWPRTGDEGDMEVHTVFLV